MASDAVVRAFPGARAINPERSVIDLPLELQGKKTALRISLPPYFPQEPPSLLMVIPIQHLSVDPNSGRVRCRSVDDWNCNLGRSNLTAVVQEALSLLLGPAPYLDRPQQEGSASGIPAAESSETLVGATEDGAARAKGALEELSNAELEKLLDDESAFKAFVIKWTQESPAAKTLQEIRRRNAEIAGEVISMQASIDETRNQVAIVRSSEFASCRGELEVLLQRQANVMAKLGPSVILDELKKTAAEVDDKSSALNDAFDSGSVPVEQFVENYMKQRLEYHTMDMHRQAADVMI
eukprot:gene18518-25021_t